MTRDTHAPRGSTPRAILCPIAGSVTPRWIDEAGAACGFRTATAPGVAEMLDEVRRGRPVLVVVDARGGATPARAACDAIGALKADAYTAVVPCVAIVDTSADVVPFLTAGADEALAGELDPAEAAARVALAVRRSVRDLAAQPTTRLPAAGLIEQEIERRIRSGEPFAACYADLDHFKEYNDRYGYHEGDRVIRMVARVLNDAAVGTAGPGAFVGHVGGDDFMLVLPLERAGDVCELALEVFDALVPFQYSEADRRAGYYFGKDRRGQLHRVPLMTLSIGVTTTERRRFRSAAEVSKLASEMKSFAKAKPGSVFAVDRRAEDLPPAPPARAAGGPGATVPVSRLSQS